MHFSHGKCFFLSYANERCICLEICLLQDSCQLFYGWGWLTLCQCYLKMHVIGEGPGATLSVLCFFDLISSLLTDMKWKWKWKWSRVRLFAMDGDWWLRSMGFSRQECWSGLPFPSPGDLPNPGIEPGSPTLQADTLPSEPPGKPITSIKCLAKKKN